ncbi:multicopper oxidase family protein [Mesobacillus sp.]|uniref:multicopper oxidase family protein n=1 Tax=Mesobacillus sp. TaxID=2675271 RepID=UPI0039EE6D22
MSNYDIFTINGKSGGSIKPLIVKEGEKMRIRFISHKIHLHGHEFKVAAIDGQELNDPQDIKDLLVSIAPGERYDSEFTANNPGTRYLERHGNSDGTSGMKLAIQYEGKEETVDKSDQQEIFRCYRTEAKSKFTLDQKYHLEYTKDLNTEMNNEGMVFTLNGKTFPSTDNINVKKGDKVLVKLVNNSMMDDHPIYLHGHFFQVLSKNEKPVEGLPIIKDPINLKPGDEYVVAFEADNPGNWLFHCHDLHHASVGMINLLNYEGFNPPFTPDDSGGNKPE